MSRRFRELTVLCWQYGARKEFVCHFPVIDQCVNVELPNVALPYIKKQFSIADDPKGLVRICNVAALLYGELGIFRGLMH